MEQELIGKMVLVHPELTTDPVNKQGKVGMITGVDLDSDTISVAFGGLKPGLYSSDALLVLKPHNELYQDLLEKHKKLDMQDFKTLLRINMLQENGTAKQQSSALEMAMSTSKVLDFSTVSLQESLDLNMVQSQAVNLGHGFRR
ncbi:hypothetical protein SAMN05216464_1134 [Mucilaginibacter pineti]|uniref:Uncharacterized protein n=1 Tax=Mucilaginibacter pineti TaxID=1391627 RepID=A0A1G7IF54_9SPHI|nr:hypothetical protein [Mucilaginibacter pineti]SDF11255.1 hypothetical protein SAMN05216464_1134 [Mucilaginibacter pineti]